MRFLENVAIKTFELSDLVNRTLIIKSFIGEGVELIAAFDIKTGETFVLKTINHPVEPRAKAGV